MAVGRQERVVHVGFFPVARRCDDNGNADREDARSILRSRVPVALLCALFSIYFGLTADEGEMPRRARRLRFLVCARALRKALNSFGMCIKL
jgi:hypothetical protein